MAPPVKPNRGEALAQGGDRKRLFGSTSVQDTAPRSGTMAHRLQAAERAGLIPGVMAFSSPALTGGRPAFEDPATSGATPARKTNAGGKRAPRPQNGGLRGSFLAASGKKITREQQENTVVTSLVAAFVLVALGFGSMRFSTNKAIELSEAAVQRSLDVVHGRQSGFRIIHQRFATWDELAADGASLEPGQEVVASNASISHWFLSVRDTTTGVQCSRTGELFDDGPNDRRASCLTIR